MAINSVTETALQGIQRGMRNMRRNAAQIAGGQQTTSKVPSKDGVRSMVELRQNSHNVAASIKVLQTAHQMIGSLLDVKA